MPGEMNEIAKLAEGLAILARYYADPGDTVLFDRDGVEVFNAAKAPPGVPDADRARLSGLGWEEKTSVKQTYWIYY